MKKQSHTTFSQWLVILSVPLTVLAVGALFRLLFDHETRMAQIEANCGRPKAVAEAKREVPSYPVLSPAPVLATPQSPFVSLAYELGAWLFPAPGKVPIGERP